MPTVWLPVVIVEEEPERWKLKKGMKFVIGGSAAPEAMIVRQHGISSDHAWGMTEMTIGTTGVPTAFDSMSKDEQFATLANKASPALR